MDFVGLYLGDGVNAERLVVSIATPPELSWKPFDDTFRTINGNLRRTMIKGLIPIISMELNNVPETTMAVLRAARVSRQMTILQYGRGWQVRRQDELMVGASFLILSGTSLRDLTDFRVYQKSDFRGTTNLFASFSAGSRVITLSSALTVGAPVYVDYSFTRIECVITALRERPMRGTLSRRYSADITFEGV